MRTIFISHLRQGKTRKSILGNLVTDYDTCYGVVREVAPKSGNKPPKYRIRGTRELVNVIMI